MDEPASSRARPDSRDVQRLRRLSRLLDSAIPLPGGFRIGLDGFLGLIPGVGDAIGASLSTYIIVQAARLGASPARLLAMIVNVLVETVLGAVPILGDLFDFAWKANDRNMALLDTHLQKNPAPTLGDSKQRLTLAAATLLLGFVLLLIFIIYLIVKLLLAIAAALGGA